MNSWREIDFIRSIHNGTCSESYQYDKDRLFFRSVRSRPAKPSQRAGFSTLLIGLCQHGTGCVEGTFVELEQRKPWGKPSTTRCMPTQAIIHRSRQLRGADSAVVHESRRHAGGGAPRRDCRHRSASGDAGAPTAAGGRRAPRHGSCRACGNCHRCTFIHLAQSGKGRLECLRKCKCRTGVQHGVCCRKTEGQGRFCGNWCWSSISSSEVGVITVDVVWVFRVSFTSRSYHSVRG